MQATNRNRLLGLVTGLAIVVTGASVIAYIETGGLEIMWFKAALISLASLLLVTLAIAITDPEPAQRQHAGRPSPAESSEASPRQGAGRRHTS